MAKVAFVGDLHFYDGNTKSHKDYFTNCQACMDKYTAEFQETKPDYIFLAGDLVGLNERVLRTRVGLSVLISYLQKWSEICHGNLYAIHGNHDYTKGESLSDFDLLALMGLIHPFTHVDINGLRVHGISYGYEKEPIEVDTTRHNIALMHAELVIDGVTNWFYQSNQALTLSSLRNLKGIELVLCGHIHNPSPKTCATSIEESPISLIYLGCATRPRRRDNWSGVWVSYANCEDNGDVSLDTRIIKLEDYTAVFNEQGIVSEGEETPIEDEEVPVVDIELLTKILDDLSPALMGSELDYRTQIKQLAGIDKAAADMAISYIDKADEHAKEVK